MSEKENGPFHSPYCEFCGESQLGAQSHKPTCKLYDQNHKERILCAAIWVDDGKYYHYQPKNIDTGLVLCGLRHPCIFQQIGGLVGERKQLGIHEREQGFLTNFNRFVGRKEALVIALEQNQVRDISDVRGSNLHSEDLY